MVDSRVSERVLYIKLFTYQNVKSHVKLMLPHLTLGPAWHVFNKGCCVFKSVVSSTLLTLRHILCFTEIAANQVDIKSGDCETV